MFELIVGLALTAFYIWMAWKVVDRAGWNGAWSLTLLIPLVNIVMIFMFAFKTWPIHRHGGVQAATFD
jgi:ATP/ADP translocase